MMLGSMTSFFSSAEYGAPHSDSDALSFTLVDRDNDENSKTITLDSDGRNLSDQR